MNHVFILATGFGIAIFAAYRVVVGFAKVLRADRARDKRLRDLERDPGDSGPAAPHVAAAELDETVRQTLREDLTVTGVFLALFGVIAVFAGREMAYGGWAVGLYTAGLCAIVGGVSISLLGAVLRVIARPLVRPEDAPRRPS